ncbi:GNAT family N-acetyltransferase [Granulicatella sp. zg-84]|uniref:GNAT family N-acetyltransferase n=1 Tax=Granulicatella sp. zg-84 TaxID=2678503 RepID=UPI0031F6D134
MLFIRQGIEHAPFVKRESIGGFIMEFVKKGNSFVYEVDGQLLGEITYAFVKDNVIDVNHTYVSETLRGQGIAKKLVDTVVAYAKEEQLKIIPTCPYVVALFEKDDVYQEIMFKE